MNVCRMFIHSSAIYWNFVKISSNPPNKYNGRYNCSSLLHMKKKKKNLARRASHASLCNITQSIVHQVSGKVSQKMTVLNSECTDQHYLIWLKNEERYYRHKPQDMFGSTSVCGIRWWWWFCSTDSQPWAFLKEVCSKKKALGAILHYLLVMNGSTMLCLQSQRRHL